MIFNIAFTIFIISMIILIAMCTNEGLKPVTISFSLFIMLFTTIINLNLSEEYIRREAIRHNAGHWKVEVNTISGNSTKVFQWGPPPNESNELNKPTSNEPNELNENNK